MSYPWDLETNVRIDADDVLDYVKDNKEWFLDKLGESRQLVNENIVSLERNVQNIIDKYDMVRRLRDSSSEHKDAVSISMYEDLLKIKEMIGDLLNA